MSYVSTLRNAGGVNVETAGLNLTPEDLELLRAGNRDARNKLAGACLVASSNAEKDGKDSLSAALLEVATLLMRP